MRNAFKYLLTLGLLFSVATLHAASLTWNGNASDSWFNSAKWLPTQTPTSADTVAVSANTINIPNTAAFAVLNISGTAIVNVTNTVTGTINMSGGTVNTGNLTIANGGVFNWSGGTVQYSALTMAAGSQLNYSGSTTKYFRYGFLTNNSTVTVIGTGDLDFYLSTVENQASGTFDFQNNQYVSYGIINNAGLLRKSVGVGTTTLSCILNNTATVSAQTGTLALAGGGVLAGTFTTVAGSVVDITGGNFSHLPGLALSGAGTFRITGGLLVLDSVIPNLQLLGGTLRLSPAFQGGSITSLTINGSTLETTNTVTGTLTLNSGSFNQSKLVVANGAALNWAGGTIQYSALTVAGGANVNISSTPAKYFRYGYWTNNGTVTVTGTGDLDLYLSTFENQASGLVDFQNNQYVSYGIINNAGLLRKSVGVATTTVNSVVNNSGNVTALTGTFAFGGGGVLDGTFNASAGAVIDFNGGTYTHAATLVLSGAGTFKLSGGTLILDAVIPNLQLVGGNLRLNPSFQGGSITNFTINGSTLATTNTVTGSLTLLSGGIEQSKLTIGSGAAFNFSGGTVQYSQLTVAAGGTVNHSGSAAKYFRYGFFTNNGTVTVAGTGDLDYYLSTIENQAAGIFDFQNDRYVSYGIINNAGLFKKSAGTGTTFMNAVFSNTGNVSILTGTMAFGGGGVLNSTFTTAAGATVDFNGGVFTHVAGLALNGPGTFKLSGGTLYLDAVIPNLQLVGGSLRLNPVFQGGVITNFTVSGSSLSTTNTVTGTLTLTSGYIDGSKLLVASGAVLNLTGGTVQYTALTVANGGAVNLSGPDAKYFRYGFWTNSGTVTVTGTGDLDFYLSTIENQAAGVFDFQNNRYVSYGTFNNAGTLRKTVGTGTTFFGCFFNNTGNVNAVTGILEFTGGGVLNGNFTTVVNSVIDLNAGTYTHLPGLALSGAGIFRITGGMIFLDSVIPNLLLAGGNVRLTPVFQGGVITNLTLNGSILGATNTITGSLTINGGGADYSQFVIANGGVLNWSGGTIQYSAVTVQTGGSISMSGTSAKYFRYGWLTNSGSITDTATGGLDFYQSDVRNLAGASINLQNDEPVNYGAINNAGMFRKSGGAGNATLSTTTFTNSGTIEGQSGTIYFNIKPENTGTLLLSGGSFYFPLNFTLTNGELRGHGSIIGSVTNASTVNPDGIMNITGDFVHTAAGSLRFDIGGLTAGSQYDRLSVSGKVVLDGVANLFLANGFVPVAGNTFQVMTFGSKSNLFSNMNGRSLGGGIFLNPVYSSTDLTLVTSDLNGLLNVISNGPGGIQLRISGGGNLYLIEACTHIKNPDWLPISTNTLPGGAIELQDPTSTNYPTRFYRARYIGP